MSEQTEQESKSEESEEVDLIEGRTLEEQAGNFVTMRHIELVRNFLNHFAVLLLKRGQKHDQSKLVEPEVEMFTRLNARLKKLTFGSPEYEESLEELGVAKVHHYANGRHHPEHFKNGIDDMNVIDILEMFVDWKAASMRQHDGNLRQSIEKAAKRFEIAPQLVRIFENSMDLFEDTE